MLVTHGILVTFGETNQIIDDGALFFENGRIADLGPSTEVAARHPGVETLDARGQVIMPGLICAHTHCYGTFARGLSIPGDPPKNFPEILERLWWRLDRSLDYEAVRYSTLVPLVEAIRNGTTTLFDHHASPNALEGSLDVIAEAVQQAGVRACLCYETTDRDGPEKANAGIEENIRFIKNSKLKARNSKLAATFGLHASFTLSNGTLERCVAAAESVGSGFHIHAAEGFADQEDSLKKYGLRTIDRLERMGILGPKSIVAHAIAIDAWEMAALRDTGTWVTHQPRSNMHNAVGVADVPAMLRGGIPVCLGNDGFSNNMFTEMQTAYLLHKAHSGDPRVMGGYDVIHMAITHNARLARVFFPEPLGELAIGAAADVILLDYRPPTGLTPDNLPWHILFGMDGAQVTTTICAGKILMRDRQLLTLDETEIAARAREVSQGVWERFAGRT